MCWIGIVLIIKIAHILSINVMRLEFALIPLVPMIAFVTTLLKARVRRTPGNGKSVSGKLWKGNGWFGCSLHFPPNTECKRSKTNYNSDFIADNFKVFGKGDRNGGTPGLISNAVLSVFSGFSVKYYFSIPWKFQNQLKDLMDRRSIHWQSAMSCSVNLDGMVIRMTAKMSMNVSKIFTR